MTLTDAERAEAATLGVTPEQYEAAKAVDRSRKAHSMGLSLADFDELEAALGEGAGRCAGRAERRRARGRRAFGMSAARYAALKGSGRTLAGWQDVGRRFPK